MQDVSVDGDRLTEMAQAASLLASRLLAEIVPKLASQRKLDSVTATKVALQECPALAALYSGNPDALGLSEAAVEFFHATGFFSRAAVHALEVD